MDIELDFPTLAEPGPQAAHAGVMEVGWRTRSNLSCSFVCCWSDASMFYRTQKEQEPRLKSSGWTLQRRPTSYSLLVQKGREPPVLVFKAGRRSVAFTCSFHSPRDVQEFCSPTLYAALFHLNGSESGDLSEPEETAKVAASFAGPGPDLSQVSGALRVPLCLLAAFKFCSEDFNKTTFLLTLCCSRSCV